LVLVFWTEIASDGGVLVDAETETTYPINAIGGRRCAGCSSLPLDWGGLRRGKRGGESEDLEEVGSHVGQYDVVVLGRMLRRCEQ
jgi:hypothetical protein